MGSATTIGLDLAKSVFQVRGVDADGEAVTRPTMRFVGIKSPEQQIIGSRSVVSRPPFGKYTKLRGGQVTFRARRSTAGIA